jgi:hypothetical protein
MSYSLNSNKKIANKDGMVYDMMIELKGQVHKYLVLKENRSNDVSFLKILTPQSALHK